MANESEVPVLGRTHYTVDCDRGWDPARVVGLAKGVLAGGITVVCLRPGEVTDRATLELARALAYLCRQRGATFTVAGRVDIALAGGADGVHLGPGDMPVRDARRLLGADAIIGAAACTSAVARRLAADGASYISADVVVEAPSRDDSSGLAETGSHGAAAATGMGMLRSLSSLAGVPVIATGVTDRRLLADVVAAGAYGVELSHIVASAPDAEALARGLADAVAAAWSAPQPS
jgi:thiamine-phosphate pyrophosphorylase